MSAVGSLTPAIVACTVENCWVLVITTTTIKQLLTDSLEEEGVVVEIILHKHHLPLTFQTRTLDHDIQRALQDVSRCRGWVEVGVGGGNLHPRPYPETPRHAHRARYPAAPGQPTRAIRAAHARHHHTQARRAHRGPRGRAWVSGRASLRPWGRRWPGRPGTRPG